MTGAVPGYLQRNTVGKQLTTTAEVTCYTAEMQFVQLASIRATNKDTTSRNLTISWVDAEPVTTSFKLLFAAPIQAGAAVHIPFDDGFTLRIGDAIKAEASAANAFDVMVTVNESVSRAG